MPGNTDKNRIFVKRLNYNGYEKIYITLTLFGSALPPPRTGFRRLFRG